MPSSTMLIEFANISSETIQHISNFISTDKDSCQMMDKRKLLNGPPDTEDRIYLDNPELSDDMSSGDLTDTVEHLQRHWLRQTLIASGPNFETLVIAFAQKFVILERSKCVSSMEIAAKIRATEEEHAYISALYVFGVAPELSIASSKPLSADWICICIGLSNGNLLFYTEHGVLLFSEKCASSSLLAIRLGPSVHPGNQELVVMTDESKLIVIEGLSLCVTLRTARRNIAHGEKSAAELSEMLQLNSQQLQINKLRRINDVLLAGLSRFATFDQYFNAFYAGGRKESISQIQLPIHSQYICTIGSRGGTKNNGEQNLLLEKDFVAFFFHGFQSNSSTLTDALYSITSKISNNIPSFGFRSLIGMGVSRKDRPQKQWLNDAQTTNIYMKSSLRDGKRLAERAFLSPYGWHFVAITDNIGRVLLIHTKLKRIVRMWKGYRQARCAWLEVESSSSIDSKQMPSKTLFLVIFAPKRGLLEVWSMENGPRVSAFEVADGGRLLSIPSTQSGILHESSDINQNSFPNLVVFLSPNGSFFSINVPFHLSALDSSTAFVHDECILKQFKSEIGKISASDQLFQFYQKIRTDDGRRNFLDLLLKFENIPIEKLNELLTKLLETKETEKHHFRQYILNLEKAIHCYCKLNKLFEDAKNVMQSGLRDNLNLEFLDLENSNSNIFSALESLEMLRKCESDSKPIVDFALHRLNLHEFAANLNFPQQNQEGMKLWRFGATLFAPVFLKPEMAAAVKEILNEINFEKEKLAEIYHTFWLDNELNMNLEEYANQSYEILKLIFLNNISNINADEMAQIMGATKKIEKAIFESTNTKGAMLLALQMNALQRQILASMNQKESNSLMKDDEKFVLFDDAHLEWQASIENADANFWTLSALNLGALSLLRFVISAKGDISKANSMNLAKMAQKGVGFYREQIGILVSYAAMEPDELIKLFSDENEGQKENEENAIFVCLKMLFRKIFPLNLRLELVICDIIWENASLWNKNGHRAIRNLELSIEFLDKLVSVPKIQHGLAEMIWDTFASKRFEQLFLLLEEQFGQRQSDSAAKHFHFLAGLDWRLKRDVHVSESNLNIYTSCVRRLLEIMAESSRHIGGRQEINYGPLAGNIYQQDRSLNAFLAHKKTNNLLHSSGDRGMMTLLQITDRQKLTNYHLVVHHYHLAAVIEIQIQLPLKSYTKPSALFDTTSGRRAFFNSLTTHPLLLMARVDDRTKARRQNFVERCTESLEENIPNYEEEKVAKIRHLIDSLVNEWQLDAANLRIKEIVKLYLYAQDEEAEERSKMLVGNRRKLSLELIPIIATRIKILLDKENGLLERIYQTSAASESTLTLINGTRNEHSPSSIDVDVTKTRKLINMAKSWLLAKERPRQHSITEIGQIDFGKCQQLLKEFDEISIVSQKMEADRSKGYNDKSKP